MQDTSQPVVLLRTLAAAQGAGLSWIDAVEEPLPDGGRLVRIFGRRDSAASLPVSPLADDFQMREVGGAQMVTARDMAPAGTPLRLTLPQGTAEIDAALCETGLLAGRNVIFGFRTAEPAASVGDWLAYHARHHGMTGALIVDRQAGSAGETDFAGAVSADIGARSGLSGLTVLIVRCPVPLGKPGLGPESHPFLAPDAPGKARMVPPDPDPWTAPLGEPLIFEAMKAHFLSRARAVLTLDCSDILADPGRQPNAFDLCCAARDGVILLAGRRIYPWRVRPGRPAAFGDHVCRQFDARRGIARWGVSPAVAGPDRTWRATRIAFARPDPGQVVPFWRAMAIRVPGHRPSVLAPKTSLVADPDLVRLAGDGFGAAPVLPPASQVRAANPAPTGAARTTVVTTMKNEGPFILEWLAWHRAIGVTDFLIYTNDCTDGTDRMLDLLDRKGLVQHRQNPYRSMPAHIKPQHAALQAAESEPAVRGADWLICMDVDEFVNIRVGDGRLPALFDRMGDANMIALTWRLFGNADVATFEDRFVTDQFPLAAQEMMRKPHQAWGFKTLFRNIDIYGKLGVHRPKGLKPDLWTEVRWLNGSGQPMPRAVLRNGWRSSVDSFGYDWVQLNHYACRSVESYLVKRDRGRVNHVDRDQGLNYWFRMNHNAVEERSIQSRRPLLQAEWDRLIADPEIAAAHAACVSAHRDRIAALLARPDQRALVAELSGDRMRRLSRLLRHFGAAVFHAGPQVIPPDLHRLTLPETFFFTVDQDGDARH
jgi:hypothetical protein